MAQDSNLGKWIREKFGSQTQLAQKLGIHPTMLSRWMGGAGISEDYRAKIRKLGYTGQWPQEEAEADARAPAGDFISREEHARAIGQLEGRIGVLERALENLAEAYRTHILTGPERAHREGRT